MMKKGESGKTVTTSSCLGEMGHTGLHLGFSSRVGGGQNETITESRYSNTVETGY